MGLLSLTIEPLPPISHSLSSLYPSQLYRVILLVPDMIDRSLFKELMNILLLRMEFASALIHQVRQCIVITSPNFLTPHHPTSSHPHHPTSSHPHHPTSSHPHHPTSSHPHHPPHHPTSSHPHHPTSSHPHHPTSSHPHRPTFSRLTIHTLTLLPSPSTSPSHLTPSPSHYSPSPSHPHTSPSHLTPLFHTSPSLLTPSPSHLSLSLSHPSHPHYLPQESLCATYSAGLSIACVVNVGDEMTHICCVEEGVSNPNTRFGPFMSLCF